MLTAAATPLADLPFPVRFVELPGELRQLTTVFVQVLNLAEVKLRYGSLRAMQLLLRLLLKATRRFDGALRQLLVDDKGTVAVLHFGLHKAHKG